MIQIKKTILTLVALLAVTTGAWADETPLLTIENKGNTSFYSGSKTFDDMVTVTFSNEVYNNGDEIGWYAGGTASLLTVAGINGYTITSCKFYTDRGTASTGYTVQGESPSVYLFTREVFTDANQSVYLGNPGITKIEVFGTAPSDASADEVAWDKDKMSGSFTMPGGNVTLEPEYFPQATVADGAVTAADADARATTDDPLVKVDATKLTGAKKLMYFVSNSGTTAPAYDAEGWTDQLPTAEGITQQGIVYVWYYPVGTDEGVDGATATYSDGDICLESITAGIAAAPTYAVTFAEGTDPNEWTASPATGVTKGQTVTVTYSGSKKVIGVKAEKKASTVPVETITLNKTETEIKVGSTETLSVTAVAPDNATDKTYTWKTSDETKATVDQDGKVTAVAAGTVTIYAEANDGSGVKGNCTVTVTSAVPEYYNKLTKINDNFSDQVYLLKQLGRGRQAYNSSLTAAQAYALATYQAAIDGKAVYVIMSSQDDGYEIHYALSTDAAATEHTADLYNICNDSNPVRMYYVAQ